MSAIASTLISSHYYILYLCFSFMNTFCRGRSLASFLFQESDRKMGILMRCICYIYDFKISLRLKNCTVLIFSASDPELLNPYPNPGIFCCIRIRIQAVAESGSSQEFFLKKCRRKIRIQTWNILIFPFSITILACLDADSDPDSQSGSGWPYWILFRNTRLFIFMKFKWNWIIGRKSLYLMLLIWDTKNRNYFPHFLSSPCVPAVGETKQMTRNSLRPRVLPTFPRMAAMALRSFLRRRR